MCYRKQQEAYENQYLSIYAVKSDHSKGRVKKEDECTIRTCFQRDRDRILHSKSFRRLAHKTQVFMAPEGDHYRTRLTHTLEVSQISRTIARALRLNEDLTEAVALGHDLGHTPFGHAGEHVLKELTKGYFSHNEQSLRVVEKLENKGKGLNLTEEVRDGILNHQTSRQPATLEAQIVRLADKIAYVNHDIDDAIRGKVLAIEDLPKECVQVLGKRSSIRINKIITDIVESSIDKSSVQMSEEVAFYFMALRKFLFQKVYIGSRAKEEEGKAKHVVAELYAYYINHQDELPEDYKTYIKEGEWVTSVVCDYIAGMTDRYATHQYYDLFCPTAWQVY